LIDRIIAKCKSSLLACLLSSSSKFYLFISTTLNPTSSRWHTVCAILPVLHQGLCIWLKGTVSRDQSWDKALEYR
jgi:hypothetical protein